MHASTTSTNTWMPAKNTLISSHDALSADQKNKLYFGLKKDGRVLCKGTSRLFHPLRKLGSCKRPPASARYRHIGPNSFFGSTRVASSRGMLHLDSTAQPASTIRIHVTCDRIVLWLKFDSECMLVPQMGLGSTSGGGFADGIACSFISLTVVVRGPLSRFLAFYSVLAFLARRKKPSLFVFISISLAHSIAPSEFATEGNLPASIGIALACLPLVLPVLPWV